jgi:predicted nucleic acid-binding Zn ribbon protein
MNHPPVGLCTRCGAGLREGSRFCSQCGNAVDTPATPERNQQPRTTKRLKPIIVVALLVVFVLLFATYLRILFRDFHPVIEKQPEIVVPIQYGLETKTPSTLITVRIVEGNLIVPLEAIKQYRLVRFFDPEGIQTTPMIAYLTPEGKIVTAMSISENCRSTDFYLQGHNIHCAACPSYWNMSSLEAYACCQRFYPDPVSSSLVGNEIHIDLQLIRRWQPRS